MALPVWGKYMKKIYEDSTLTYSPEVKFEPPSERITIDLDCEDNIIKNTGKSILDDGNIDNQL